jgi:FkbH-like protein
MNRPYKCGEELDLFLVADTMVDPILRFLGNSSLLPVIKARVAPFNQVRQVLAEIASSDSFPPPETLMVWTSPHGSIPSFSKIQEFEPVILEDLLGEVDQVAAMICQAAGRVGMVLVLSWALPPYRRWVQAMTLQHEKGLSNILMRMNLRLAEKLAKCHNIILLDCQHWYASLQKPAYDPKLHALAKVDYSRDFFLKAAAEIKAVLRGVRGEARKLVICDLDNTLWGGVVGDDGIDNLKLGGHDGAGESYAAFQRELQTLRKRGVLLALCSKNDSTVAWEAIDHHPEMVLRRKDFASVRINWNDKAENIAEIVKELNLLPKSAVFLDDHPAERDRVRQAFPEILTPDLPLDVAEYPSFLASLDCFETNNITFEDVARTELYLKEAERRADAASMSSIEEWLESLKIVIHVRPLERGSLVRATQLLNKTNQFNMATRRLEQEEFWRWSTLPGRHTWVFSVADRLGESGITGLISAESIDGNTACLTDFLMSCRVMGKHIEDAMLYSVKEALAASGLSQLRVSYTKTARNQPFLDFIQNKWTDAVSGVLDPAKIIKPQHVQIVNESENYVST